MTVKHAIREWALKAGIEVHRYDVVESSAARQAAQRAHHCIDLVLDVGANDGGYGRALRKSGYQGHILSFEPLSSAHSKLVLAAASDERWHVAPRCALGETDGEITINIAGNSASSSVLPMSGLHADAEPTSKYSGQEVTPVFRLDGFRHQALSQAKAMLLKIDTQGFEMSVLKGADAVLDSYRGVHVELSADTLYEGQALFDKVIAVLLERGFGLWDVCPAFVDPRTGRMLQFDGVFYRA